MTDAANHDNNDIQALPKQHASLINFITRLPPKDLLPPRILTTDQDIQWNHSRAFWYWIGKRIDYLQKKACGYLPCDPLIEVDYPEKIILSTSADTFFAELNLMIAGWDLIKSASILNQREFIFANPRELFSKYCRDRAAFATQYFLTDAINQGETLGELRQHYRNLSAFYRGRLTPEEEASVLQIYSGDDDWLRFTIYALWRDLHKNREIKQAWRNYLDAFKAESAMVCRKDFFKKHRIVNLRWHQGKAINPESNQGIRWMQP